MKGAAAKPGTTTLAQDDVERSLAVLTARKQFFAVTANMSWQLALTIIVPVIIGVKLDDRFNSSPAWTLTALTLGVAAGCAVVWRIMKQVAVSQAKPGARNR